jgi:hypothetical protein
VRARASRRTYSIVSTQRGTLGFQPIAFKAQLQRVLEEVVDDVAVLFANHVDVPLKDHHWSLLAPPRPWPANHQIANPILAPLKATVLRKALEVLENPAPRNMRASW